MRWVRQEDRYGCGVAVLAMLTGESYSDIRAEIDAQNGHGHNGDWSKGGVTHVTLDRLLTARGWYMQRVYPHERAEWPPQAWSADHYAQVIQPSGNSHFVAMAADGAVFDPMREGVWSLGDWPKVANVVGLVSPDVLRTSDYFDFIARFGQ